MFVARKFCISSDVDEYDKDITHLDQSRTCGTPQPCNRTLVHFRARVHQICGDRIERRSFGAACIVARRAEMPTKRALTLLMFWAFFPNCAPARFSSLLPIPSVSPSAFKMMKVFINSGDVCGELIIDFFIKATSSSY
jgi:hypothetical protein